MQCHLAYASWYLSSTSLFFLSLPNIQSCSCKTHAEHDQSSEEGSRSQTSRSYLFKAELFHWGPMYVRRTSSRHLKVNGHPSKTTACCCSNTGTP
ncbi:hypothetical protein GQ43DRAFT_229551 [Delitschia confertaspora ATCC 74209]|uniref:Secreted protein n=1 Tax=Delitschia confertaspora ATCC 74209 TaxID=1513339 RepID=A0A9P4JCY5_9PLEO|nr:hypothetical protein GQ43DRAFT_229551 [Delitschia confertaspora ATCC 74209]